MARTGKPRNSAPTRKPVTIDLEAETEEPVAQMAADATADVRDDDALLAEPVAMEEATEDNKLAEDDRSEKPEPVSPPPPPAAKPARGGAFGAGLAGGLLAFVGAAALQWGGVLTSPDRGQPAAQMDLAPLQAEIDALKQAVDAAPAGGAATSDAMAAIIDKMSALESQTTSAIDGLSATINGVGKRIDEADRKLAEIGASGGASSGDPAALISVQAALDETKSTVASLVGKIDTLQQESSAGIEGLSASLNGIGARVDAAEKQVTEMSQRGGDASVARAIAAAGLKSAIDRGGPFMTELEAYATVAGDTQTVAELRANAASGVLTQALLVDAFGSVANRIVAAGTGVDENASMTDRLMASARSLVQIRPVGEVAGETPGAITARIERRIKAGDISAALEEWNTLPDAGKQVSQEFADQMQARLTVDALVAKALTGAMASTTANQ